MNNTLSEHIKSEIIKSEYDIAEAAFWTHDAVTKGDEKLCKLFGVTPHSRSSRDLYKIIFNAFLEYAGYE